MYNIVYVSFAVNLFSNSELLELLTNARLANEKLDVTGMLLYKDGFFIQTIEGEEHVIKELQSKIQADQRHTAFQVIAEGEITERSFPDWSMGFCDLASEEVKNFPGYSEFFNLVFTQDELHSNKSLSLELMHLFKESFDHHQAPSSRSI